MTDDNSKRDEYPPGYRWQLAEGFRQRSDQAANYLRGLLFALSAGAVAYIANHLGSGPLSLHLLSMLSFGVAIAFIVWSWDRQKSKSIARLIELRDKGYDDYLKLEQYFAKYRKNETIDRWSYLFLAGGFLVELAAKATELCR